MRKPKLTLKRSIWAGLLMTPVLVTAIVILTASAASTATRSNKATTAAAPIRTAQVASPSAVAAYWTPARMASAIDADTVAIRPGQPSPQIAGNTATGAPAVAGGALPSGQPMASSANGLSTSSGGVSPTDGGLPGPHTTWPWFGNYTRFPTSTIGKIFFTKPGGGNFVCSGAVTVGGRNDTVWTAGHCVNSGGSNGTLGTWWTNELFCPSYDNGAPNADRDCWPASQLGTSGGWGYYTAYSRDYGVIFTTSCNRTGNHCGGVAATTGGLGFAWNWGRDQHWMMFGYPSENLGFPSNWSGNKIVATAAEHRFDDGGDAYGPADNSIGTAQTRGTSGGPWTLNFNGGNYNGAAWINSDNSYTYCNGDCSVPGSSNYNGKEIYGPYYDTQACSDWKFFTSWSGTC